MHSRVVKECLLRIGKILASIKNSSCALGYDDVCESLIGFIFAYLKISARQWHSLALPLRVICVA